MFIPNPQLIAQPFRKSLWQGVIVSLDVITRQYRAHRCITGSVKLEAELMDKTKVTLFIFHLDVKPPPETRPHYNWPLPSRSPLRLHIEGESDRRTYPEILTSEMNPDPIRQPSSVQILVAAKERLQRMPY